MDYIYKIKDNIRTLLHTGFGHIFIANVINQIISFISGFILIRVLTKSDYGIYSYAFNIYSFIAFFISSKEEVFLDKFIIFKEYP